MIRPLPPSKIPPPFRKRKAGTLDLEWHPETYQLRCAGVYYRGRYRWFSSIVEFLEWFLTPENNGLQLWAHYGGRADFAFIIPALIEAGIQCDGLVIGSSVFALTIHIGRRQYFLRDSFHLLLCGLDEAGRAFVGRGKTDCSFTAPLRELLEYNRADCVLLWDVLCALDDLWGQLGTHIGLTNAGTAFSLFRAKYLKEEIPTIDATNDVFRRRAFYASLVAVYCRSVQAALERAGAPYAVGYDQRSAHPASYCGPMPGRQVDSSAARPPKTDAHTGKELLWFADCDISVPETVNIPPIPVRLANGRICHPVGSKHRDGTPWRALLFKEQIELLESCGGRIEKVHRYRNFEVNRDLEGYANALYDIKSKATTIGLTTVAKYALNGGGFGKFAERPQRLALILGQIPAKYLYDKDGKPLKSAEDIRIMSPTVAFVPTFRPAAHEHVPMACVTAGRSMCRLIGDMQEAERHGALSIYADTDGAKWTLPTDGYAPRCGEALGENQLEYPRIEQGFFAGPKFYAMKDTQLMRTIVRVKAFPVARYGEKVRDEKGVWNGKRKGLLLASDEDRPESSLMTFEKVRSVALSGARWAEEQESERPTEHTVKVEFERMRRIPETLAAYKRGSLSSRAPGAVSVRKEPKGPIPSRCFDSQGFSVPWALDEIEALTLEEAD